MSELWECGDIYGGKMPFADRARCDHPQCAIAQIEKLESELAEARKKIELIQDILDKNTKVSV